MVLVLIALIARRHDGPTTLLHKFAKGEKSLYRVEATIDSDFQPNGLTTWFPVQYTFKYQFSTEVKSLGADGIADVNYKMPTLTEITGETYDKGPQTKVNKQNANLIFKLSGVNDVLDETDLTPKKPKKKDDKSEDEEDKGGQMLARFRGPHASVAKLDDFVSEVHSLCLGIGPNGIDLAPRLPIKPVNVGDTWKHTVSYQPQRSAKTGKTAVQRLDYTFTYRGLIDVDGVKVARVDADLELKTDLSDYYFSATGLSREESRLKAWPLNAKIHGEYDLDPKTFKTRHAVVKSTGDFRLEIGGDEPGSEAEKFKGQTELTLVNSK